MPTGAPPRLAAIPADGQKEERRDFPELPPICSNGKLEARYKSKTFVKLKYSGMQFIEIPG
jgi:hypothetical protein